MSDRVDFCEYVPNDPFCREDEDPLPDVVEEQLPSAPPSAAEIYEAHRVKMDLLRANVTFLAVAGASFLYAGARTLRYRGGPRSSHYWPGSWVLASSGEALPNYWQLLNQTIGYFNFVLMGVAAVTQALSMAGIAVDANIKVWQYGGVL